MAISHLNCFAHAGHGFKCAPFDAGRQFYLREGGCLALRGDTSRSAAGSTLAKAPTRAAKNLCVLRPGGPTSQRHVQARQ